MSGHGWRDGQIGGAFLMFVKILFIFVIVPLSAYALLTGLMDIAAQNGTELFDGSSQDQIMTLARDTLVRALAFSIPLLIIAIPMGFYPAGNAAKIPFRLMFAIYLAIWTWIVTTGGIFDFAISGIQSGSMDISSISVTLDLTLLIYIVIILCIVKGFLAFSEYGSNREKYLEDVEEREYRRGNRGSETS